MTKFVKKVARIVKKCYNKVETIIGGAEKMIKLNKKLIISIIIFLGIIMISNGAAMAINTNTYNPNPKLNNGIFWENAQNLFGWIRFIGIMVATVAIAFMGLKYMFGSLEEKAEYKKTIFPYLVGCFMILNVSLLIGLIEGVVTDEKTTAFCVQCQKEVQLEENGDYECGHMTAQ